MVHAALLWLLVSAFLGAGLFNAVGTSGTRRDFVHWGYRRGGAASQAAWSWSPPF